MIKRKENLKCSGQTVQQNAAGKNNFVALSAAANFSKCATLFCKINQFIVRWVYWLRNRFQDAAQGTRLSDANWRTGY